MDDKDPTYYDNINPDLYNAVPDDAETVLEVGCGAGRLGMEIKKRLPGCRYYGIEIDAKSAAVAATRLDMVLCGAVEGIDTSFLQGQVDRIIYGDVLEHLVDPWKVIKAHRALLKPDGRMIACIPNVQHWSVVASLMQGNWDYRDSGLLDVTHLRFFTLPGILSLFERAEMKVDSVIGRIPDAQSADVFFQAVEPVLGSINVDPAAFRERTRIFQYVVQAALP
jgi:SAM-dependent methyltransferase